MVKNMLQLILLAAWAPITTASAAVSAEAADSACPTLPSGEVEKDDTVMLQKAYIHDFGTTDGVSRITWILAAQGSSCRDACGKEGRGCDEQALQHAYTAEEVVRVARAAGVQCASKIGATVGWHKDFNPGICTSKKCCGDGSCTGVCAVGRTGKGTCATPSGEYSRLCPCNDGPPPPMRTSLPSWFWDSSIRGMQTDGGFSWYTRVFSLLQEAPMDWQMGAAGSWLAPTNIDFDVCACDPHGWPSSTKGDPSFGCCDRPSKCSWLYSTIEGGPGYWSGSSLPTQTMKWRIVVTTACYEKGAQTPLFFYGGKTLACDDLGVIQLSNRMLLAPDGISFSHEGLLGVGFVRTPLGKTSEDDDRNFWTFVVDSQDFAGPVAYLLPELFRERPRKWRAQSAHLKDFGSPGVGMSNGGGFGFEWNTLYSYKQEGFFKIPRLALPATNGKTVLAAGGRGYDDADVFDPLEDALSKGRSLAPEAIMARWTDFECQTSEGDAFFKVSDKDTALLGKLRTERTSSGCTWSVTTDNSSGGLPQYFRAADMRPVDESAVPSGLRSQKFPEKGSIFKAKPPYDAHSRPPAGSCLMRPGPADGNLHCVQTPNRQWAAYRWYRFVDQPGLQRLGLNNAQKHFMQTRVESLHRMLTGKDRWIKAGATADAGLAKVVGAHLVTPPAHMEVGYVPIAVYEGVEKPSGCR